MEEQMIKNEVQNFNFDESDIALIRILKNKLVRKQLYDLAAQLRDVEKSIIFMIEEQSRKASQTKLLDYKESLEFGDFLLHNFTSCHWWTDTTTPHTKVFGYSKNDDLSGITYSTENVFKLFVLEKMKEKFVE